MNVRAKPLSLKDYSLDDTEFLLIQRLRFLPQKTMLHHGRTIPSRYRAKKPASPTITPTRPAEKPSKSALTAFQYVITAVKCLPFAAGRLTETEKPKKSILARRISKKIINKSTTFWRRKPNEKKIGGLKSFDELLEEDPVSSDRSNISINDGYGNCWPGSDTVTAAVEACSSCNPKFTEVDPVGGNFVLKVALKDKKESNGETMAHE